MKIEFDELGTDLAKITIPCAVQAKYDGELVVWKEGRLVNKYGRERFNMPCTAGLPPDVELIGELYWETGKSNFYEAQSHLKNDDPLLKLALFSFYKADMSYVEQYRLLTLLANHNDQRKIVESMNAYSHMEVKHYHDCYRKDGFEGSVIKPLPSKSVKSWIKWKPDLDCDLYILGISKEHSAIAVGNPEGVILGHCSIYGKEDMVSRAIGQAHIIGESKEDFLIKPEVLVEVAHLGVINKSGKLRSPRLKRIREDK
jgi:hypothetical protein